MDLQKVGAKLVTCQLSIVSLGERAKFKRAKFGLMRKGSKVYIVTISANDTLASIKSHMHNQNTKISKFLVSENTIELLPASIKLKELDKILFVRQANDEKRYSTMLREIKVILRENKLRENGKAEAVDKLISTIPAYQELDLSLPPPSKVRIQGVGCGGGNGVEINGSGSGCNADFWLGGDVINTTNNEILSSKKLSTDLFNIQNPCHLSREISFDSNNLKDISENNDSQNKLPSKVTLTTTLNNKLVSNSNKRQYPQLDNKQLKCIKISGLERLPKSLWFRSTLYELTLSDCNLTFIPTQLERFARTLVSLDLSNNRIDKLPRSFCCKMSKLEYLNINNNQLETLPLEIKFLVNMIKLDLSKNNLRMLPTTFSDLKKLRKLNVAYNNLSQLPAFKSEDIRLSELDVSHNPLDGASSVSNTFEVYPSIYDGWNVNYMENLFSNDQSKQQHQQAKTKQIPKLFEISLLKIVRNNRLFKLASEEKLPRTIVSTMQRDIFKCYRCSKMSILPAYNTTDVLDYLSQVEVFYATGTFSHGMTFMKLLCRGCFDNMSS